MNLAHQNILRTYLYMAILSGIVGFVAYWVSQAAGLGSSGIGITLIFMSILNFVSYYFSDRIVLSQSNAHEVIEADAPEYFQIVKSLIREANLPMPKLYVIPDNSMNAFATGRDPQHAAVAVTSGLLQRLSSDEISGVIAHELSHVQNYDIRLMSIVSILVGFLSILSNMLWRIGLFGRGSDRESTRGNALIGLVLVLVTPIVGMLIQFAISRQREFLADASAASLTRNPRGLMNALLKIERGVPLANADIATAHLYISNPFGDTSTLTNLFSTHPPIAERVERLSQMKV